MYRRPRGLFATGGIGVALVLIAVLTYQLVHRGSTESTRSGYTVSTVSIPANGAKLSAELLTPTPNVDAPLLVMPGPWGADASFYDHIGALFAESGYQVVAYAQRGFGRSTGEIDFAGPATQRDASTVITWALRHTRADARHVAMLGTSYGAGVALLTAAHDRRVRAVAALSTWASIAQSFDQDNTPNVAGLLSLLRPDRKSYDPAVRRLRATLLDSPRRLGAVLRAMSPSRSPDRYVHQLNANKPAIMIANAFEDSLLNPRQLVPFFDRLSTPKRLELAAGDHGGPELAALSGEPDQTIDDAKAWLDHYVRGTANGIDTEDPIVFRDVRTGLLHTFAKWPTPGRKDQVPLAVPNAKVQPADAKRTPWIATIAHAGVESGASSGGIQLGSSVYNPPRALPSLAKPAYAFVWNGATLSTSITLGGIPTVRLQMAATSRTATIYLYLYDVDAAGRGALVDFQPYTATGLSRTSARYLTIDMQPISWSVPAGDHLTLVIDTADQRYQSMTPAGSSVTVASSRSRPAEFAVPFTT